MSKFSTVQLPWRPGSCVAGERVWITASRLSFDSFATLTRAGPGALRLWTDWITVPNSVGLSMRIQPTRLASWTVSVWADESGSRDFVESAVHQAVMTRFSGLGVTGTEFSWTADALDLKSAWVLADSRLDPRHRSPLA